jgi:hypothetical protein
MFRNSSRDILEHCFSFPLMSRYPLNVLFSYVLDLLFVPCDRFGCSTVNTGTGCAMFVCSMTVLSHAFPGISFSDIKSGTTGFTV